MSFRDPIVEEVWRMRAAAREAFGDDPDRYFRHLVEEAAKHPERLIGPEEFKRLFGTSDERNPLPEPLGDDAAVRCAS